MIGVESFSEVGGHRLNEDAFRVQAHPLDAGCWLCIVADGQGGRAGGGRAAQIACDTALASACGYRPEELANPSTWYDILRKADAAVEADTVAGFTTLVALCVYRNRVVGTSSGDSAALLVSGGKPNILTANQHKTPPVGCGAAVAVPFTAAVEEPWRMLVMSDGVWKYVGWDRIVEVARRANGPAVITELQQVARLPRSGRFQDDFTIVVLESAMFCSQPSELAASCS